MVNIELTPQQVEELKNFYIIELEKIQKRASEIKALLDKLDSKPLDINEPVTLGNKVKLKTKVTAHDQKVFIEPKERKTKNPNWINYVVELLKEQNKPLTSKEIIQSYEKQHSIDLSNSKYSVNALRQALHRLRVKNNRITNIKVKGKTEKLYGLIEWVDKSVVEKTAKAKKIKPVENANQKPKTIIKQVNKPPLVLTYNWPKFIFETLNKTKRVLTAKDFLKYAMVYYSIPKHEMEKTRGKLSPSLSRLERISKSLKTCKKDGQPGRFYGLPNWFDKNNKLIATYK